MKNKYKVQIKESEVDVYDILQAYKITNPAIQHAIKKLFKAGKRGYKDKLQDYHEAIQSIERAKELEIYKTPLTYEELRDLEMKLFYRT